MIIFYQITLLIVTAYSVYQAWVIHKLERARQERRMGEIFLEHHYRQNNRQRLDGRCKRVN